MRQDADARKQRVKDLDIAVEEALQDKGGITVTCKEGIDFGVVTPERCRHSFTVHIEKTDPEADISLIDFRMTSSVDPASSIRPSFEVELVGTKRKVGRKPRSLLVRFFPAHAGRYQDVLELVFYDVKRMKCFKIIRKLFATVGSKEDHEDLKPIRPYARRKFIPLPLDGLIIRGVRPPTWTPTKWTTRLPPFKAPPALIKAAFSPGASASAIKRFLPASFNANSYGKYFEVLIHIETEQNRLVFTGTHHPAS
jgi:helicase MOV-10